MHHSSATRCLSLQAVLRAAARWPPCWGPAARRCMPPSGARWPPPPPVNKLRSGRLRRSMPPPSRSGRPRRPTPSCRTPPLLPGHRRPTRLAPQPSRPCAPSTAADPLLSALRAAADGRLCRPLTPPPPQHASASTSQRRRRSPPALAHASTSRHRHRSPRLAVAASAAPLMSPLGMECLRRHEAGGGSYQSGAARPQLPAARVCLWTLRGC
ncbi:unnamed protein product [Urochloa humidicola]